MHVFDIHATANIFDFSNCATIIRLIPFWTGKTFAITLHSNCFFLLLFFKKIACGKNYVHVIWPRVFCAMMILAHEMRLFFIFFEWVGATKCAAENNKHVFIETAVFSLSIIRLRSGFFANSPSAQHYNCQWVFFIYAHDARYWLKRKIFTRE